MNTAVETATQTGRRYDIPPRQLQRSGVMLVGRERMNSHVIPSHFARGRVTGHQSGVAEMICKKDSRGKSLLPLLPAG